MTVRTSDCFTDLRGGRYDFPHRTRSKIVITNCPLRPAAPDREAEFARERCHDSQSRGGVRCVENALTSADATITPSAKPATRAACAASEILIPTQTGSSVVA